MEDHGERVARYCNVLLRRLRGREKFQSTIDPAFRRHFFSACPLYDIGCMGIPSGILLKQRQLSTEEYELLKEHPKRGARMFEQILKEFPEAGFLAMARDMAATHHERYDGSGYPDGLKGEQIPLVGRILFLADTYDALTSENRGRKPFNHDYAKWVIVQGRKIHFDPDVVDAFLDAEAEFLDICFPPTRENEIVIEL